MNRNNFFYESLSIGEIIINPIQIQSRGGNLFPRLYLPVRLNLNKLDKEYVERVPRFVINTAKAELFIEERREKISECLVFTDILYTGNKPNATNLGLEFPLDANKINRIELFRNDDMTLNLNISFQLGIFGAINVTVDARTIDKKYFITDYQNKLEEFNVEIPQSHWLKNVLPNLGVGEYFVIELPKGNNVIKEAWEYISKAENAFKHWDSKGVFANCRELGELLNGKVRDKLGKTSFAFVERWGRRYGNYTHIASLDLHLENLRSSSNKYSFDDVKTYKTDAESMILSAKILIKYAQELLDE